MGRLLLRRRLPIRMLRQLQLRVRTCPVEAR